MGRTPGKKRKAGISIPVRDQHPVAAAPLGQALAHMQAHNPDFFRAEGVDPGTFELGVRIKRAQPRAGLKQK